MLKSNKYLPGLLAAPANYLIPLMNNRISVREIITELMRKITPFILAIVALVCIIVSCSKSSPTKSTSTQTGGTTPPPVDTVKPPVTAFKTLNYLYSISGSKTVAGIHNREPNATPAVWTDSIFKTTGKFPAFWSGDFLFEQDNIDNRQIMINEAITQWGNGALVHLMWHACNPALSEPCGYDAKGVLSTMTDQQWADLFTDGTTVNTQWKGMMDEVCVYLQQLKDKNIEVLWRPLHEMNQASFWWGGRPGPDGTRKLYQYMHDYMTNTKKLTNLIWIWDLQDFGTLSDDVNAYNPGSNYYDIAALDVYDGSGYTAAKYNTMVTAAAGKPIAIGECEVLPTAAQLLAQPKWTFFMSWSELTYAGNTNAQLKALYTAPNVVTLDKMPGWK
jgi:mannan endo-1,4-beta-mannosidase